MIESYAYGGLSVVRDVMLAALTLNWLQQDRVMRSGRRNPQYNGMAHAHLRRRGGISRRIRWQPENREHPHECP